MAASPPTTLSTPCDFKSMLFPLANCLWSFLHKNERNYHIWVLGLKHCAAPYRDFSHCNTHEHPLEQALFSLFFRWENQNLENSSNVSIHAHTVGKWQIQDFHPDQSPSFYYTSSSVYIIMELINNCAIVVLGDILGLEKKEFSKTRLSLLSWDLPSSRGYR